MEDVCSIQSLAGEIMEQMLASYDVPKEKQVVSVQFFVLMLFASLPNFCFSKVCYLGFVK